MAQMNPLIGPKLDNVTILVMAREWVSKKKYQRYKLMYVNRWNYRH